MLIRENTSGEIFPPRKLKIPRIFVLEKIYPNKVIQNPNEKIRYAIKILNREKINPSMRVQFFSLKKLRICTIRKSTKRFGKSKLLEKLELPHHGGSMKKEKQLPKAAVIRQ